MLMIRLARSTHCICGMQRVRPSSVRNIIQTLTTFSRPTSPAPVYGVLSGRVVRLLRRNPVEDQGESDLCIRERGLAAVCPVGLRRRLRLSGELGDMAVFTTPRPDLRLPDLARGAQAFA